MSIGKGINYKKLSEETEGLSGADLRALWVEAGMSTIKDKRIKINSKDFNKALDKIKNRLNETEISEPEGGLYYWVKIGQKEMQLKKLLNLLKMEWL